jgi:hypothetical protein
VVKFVELEYILNELVIFKLEELIKPFDELLLDIKSSEELHNKYELLELEELINKFDIKSGEPENLFNELDIKSVDSEIGGGENGGVGRILDPDIGSGDVGEGGIFNSDIEGSGGDEGEISVPTRSFGE